MTLRTTAQKVQDKTMPLCTMVVAAAGGSTRMGGVDKLFALVGGIPVLLRTLWAIDNASLVSEIIVAAGENNMEEIARLCAGAGLRKPIRVVRGGATRVHSVLSAALEAQPKTGIIAVHDGARPFATPALIDEMIRAGYRTQAAAPAVPVKDTVKVVGEDGAVITTPDRATLRAVQTPQVFHADLLKAALTAALQTGAAVTDDCSAVELLGKKVYLFPGEERNIKITTPQDLAVAESMIGEELP